MTTPLPPAIRQALDALARDSFVAHRDAAAVLPQVMRHGEQSAAEWLTAAHALFAYHREAGLAFIRATSANERTADCVRPWARQALAFTALDGAWEAATAFVAGIAGAYRALGPAGEQRWAQIAFQWCRRDPQGAAAFLATGVEDLAGGQGITGVEQIMAPAESLYEERRLALATYLSGAVKVRNLFGIQAVLPWARRGADVMQVSRTRGEAWFRLESPESLDMAHEALPGYLFAEHRHLLAMLVQAWFDAPPELKQGSWSPARGRPFVETDGRTLFVPVAMPGRESAILGVVHCAGHLAHGSYDADAPRRLLAERGIDAGEQRDWAALTAGDEALALLFDLCEDLRVDVRIAARVPNHLPRMIRAARAQGAPGGEAAPWWNLALATLERAQAMRTGAAPPELPCGAAPPELPCGGEAQALLDSLLEPDARVDEAFHAALRLRALLPLTVPFGIEARQALWLPGRSPNHARPIQPPQQVQPVAAQGDPQGSDSAARMRRSGDRQCESEGEGESRRPRRRQQAGRGPRGGAGVPRQVYGKAREAPVAESERGFPYPEWDYREALYKRNWAWVQEARLGEADAGEASRLLGAHAHALRRLKRAIQALKPTRAAPRPRQLEGEDLDLDAAVAWRVEHRAGLAPRPAVFRRRELRSRDVAVTLLADLSTSIMQKLPGGAGRVVDRIRAGMLLFAESMEQVGDPYAIAGFSSKYRDNVSYYPIKDFDAPLTGAVRATLGGLSGRLATRMGAAVRHAVRRFDAAPAGRRLLLILTDGKPEDYDDGGDARYLREDTRMAVKEAIDAGIHPFCISLDPVGGEYLPVIFGRGHYLVLERVDALPEKLPEIYLRLRR